MKNVAKMRRTASRKLKTVEDVDAIPAKLHPAILAGFKARLAEIDYVERMNEWLDDDESVSFTYETLGVHDLIHEGVVDAFANEAWEFTYIHLDDNDGESLHTIVAFGSPTTGFILDDEGQETYDIYDGRLRRTGEGWPTYDAELTALHALVYTKKNDVSVADIKSELSPKECEMLFDSAE